MTTSAGHGDRAPARDPRRVDMAFPSVLALGPRTRRIRAPLALLLGSVAFAFFSIRGLWDDGMLAFGDLPRFPTDASVFVDGFRESWSDRGFGGVYPSITWFLFLAGLLAVTGEDASLAQQLAMTLWIPVAFCGMAFLCRRFIETSWWFAAIGGLLYVATPVSIGLFVGGAVGLIWSYALLPLVLAGAEAVRRSTGSNIAWLALPVALLAATSPELLVFGFLVAIVWLVVGRDREPFLLVAIIGLSLATVATIPALVGRSGVRLSGALLDKMTTDFEYTYAEITPQHLLRLAGNHGDPMDPLGYNEPSSWSYAGYLLVAALVVGLLLRRRGDVFVLRLVALASVVFGALLGIAALTRSRPDIFADFTASFVFRNPGKLMMLLAVAIVPAAVYGLHRLFAVFPQHREILRFIVAGGLVAYFGAYAGPALSGDWGVKEVRGSAYEADAALFASARFVQSQDPNAPGRWRAVWVPFDHTDALNLEWISPYWANEPVPENRDPAVEEPIALLEDAFDELDVRQFHAIADRSAVRYVVLRQGADPNLDRMFASDPKMEFLRQGRGFVVWRNSAALPRIRQFSGLKAVVLPKPQEPTQYRSAAVLTLSPTALTRPTSWTTYGTRGWSRSGATIRASSTGARWPILARRVPAAGEATYLLSAQVRTRNAADAHLKVLWFRDRGDRHTQTLDQDFAEPVLDGSHGWTRVTAVVESPKGTKFGEVAFLAGRRAEGSRRPALSWIRNLRLTPLFVSDPPATSTDAVAEVVPHIGARGYEIVDAGGVTPEAATMAGAGLLIDGVVVNPGAATIVPPSLRRALRPARTEIVARAEATLRPRSGGWQRQGDSAVVVSSRASAVLPLGIVSANRYVVTLTGCRLRSGAIRIVRPGGAFEQAFAGPARGCGRFTSTRPVRLRGRSALRMSLERNASLAAVQVVPAGRRQRAPQAAAGPITVSGANTPSPSVGGLSSPGLTLADAHHPGWETSGSGSTHLRTYPGFNSFVVDEPSQVSGLRFGPQRDRNLLVLVGLLAWAAIGGLLLFRRRVSPRPTINREPGREGERA
jgi:hypothetical protein